MKKINILHPGSKFKWAYNFGYWSPINFFKDEIRESGYEINYFNRINNNFFNADFIFIASRYFTDSNIIKTKKKLGIKTEFKLEEKIKKISKINPNIIWFDLSDSVGTTAFEIMPYIKKYAKNQLYSDISNYKKNFFRNRIYADYYQNKFKLEKNLTFNYKFLENKFENKLVQSWNIGVGNYFDCINRNIFDKNFCVLKGFLSGFQKKDFKKSLKMNSQNIRENDIFIKSNLRLNSKKKSIFFQRYLVSKILNEKYGLKDIEKRINHKKYLKSLANSKVSVGSFGWGEICYREFEAVTMGACVIFPDISYIKTWPNIYKNNENCLMYDFDLQNLEEKINEVLTNEKLRINLVKNSQNELQNVYKETGLNYILEFLKKITE